MKKKIMINRWMKVLAILCFGGIIVSCGGDDGDDDIITPETPNHEDVTPPDVAPKSAEAIDLGLSVKWANINIGATSVEDAGNFVAWGELSDAHILKPNRARPLRGVGNERGYGI